MASILRRLSKALSRGNGFESYVAELHDHNCEYHDCHGTPSLDEAKRDYQASARLRDSQPRNYFNF